MRAAQVESQLRILGATTPSAMRHADLLNAELSAARGDAHAALQASEVIYIRDTTLVRLSPFARATTYLNRGKWQSGTRHARLRRTPSGSGTRAATSRGGHTARRRKVNSTRS